MEVLNLGLIEYSEALKLQETAVSALRSDRENSKLEKLIACEHPNVITVGRALKSRDEIFSDTIPIFEITRGGRSTLHLPGQIVCYPILNLSKRGKDLHAYMRTLETSIIETLEDFRIEGATIKGKTGVWVEQKKIASIGIAVKDWVSYHGIALNVNCDLKQFRALKPCGFSADVMTSVSEELSELYKDEWSQVTGNLFRDVRLRLVENLTENLSQRFVSL